MNLTINFNWPTGEDSAAVEMGGPNVEDAKYEFRIGAIPKEHQDKIWWSDSDWVVGDERMERITFRARRGDRIRVERRKLGTQEVDFRSDWDITEHWPPEAHGPAMTVVPWHF